MTWQPQHFLKKILPRVVVTLVTAVTVILSTTTSPTQASEVLPKYKDLNYSTAIKWTERKTSKTCPTPRWIQPTKEQLRELRQKPGKGNRIVVIGDSLTRESYWQIAQDLLNNGWLPTLVCWGGKGSEWGLQQLRRLSAAKRLPAYVMVSVGVNDLLYWATPRTFDQRVKATTQYLQKRVKHFWWLNISVDLKRVKPRFRHRLAQYRKFNHRISYHLKMSRTKGELINWNRQVSRNPRHWISRDGIHDTAAGRKLRTAVITNRVRLTVQ